MPMMLEKPDFARRLVSEPLAREEAERLLAPSPAGSLVARPVSSRVNTVRNDDESLIEEISPASR
jgi:putative SOS response-associated peptidase YedK